MAIVYCMIMKRAPSTMNSLYSSQLSKGFGKSLPFNFILWDPKFRFLKMFFYKKWSVFKNLPGGTPQAASTASRKTNGLSSTSTSTWYISFKSLTLTGTGAIWKLFLFFLISIWISDFYKTISEPISYKETKVENRGSIWHFDWRFQKVQPRVC